MDNQPNTPRPPMQEEPPLQQTPEMLNQQPPQPPVQEPTPPEQASEPSKKNKKWLIAVIIVAVIIIGLIIASIVYWATALNTLNDVLEEQDEITQMMDEYRIEDVDGLMYAYETKSALDCSYIITQDGESYDIIEQANEGWQSHKTTAVSVDGTATILMITGDAVYSWGYDIGGEEFANKISWEKFNESQGSELLKQFDAEQAIIDAKDTITSLVCYATDSGADYSIPEREWVDVSSSFEV